MIYISVTPFQWRWAFSANQAQHRSLETFKTMKRRGMYRIKIPMKLFTLKEGVSQKKFHIQTDTKFLGNYEAVARGGKWLINNTN